MDMITVKVSADIAYPPKDVWRILGGFDDLAAISTGTANSRLEEGGRIRVLLNRDGGILWERLIRFDEEQRFLEYEITDAKACDALAYGAGYRGIVRVVAKGAASVFEYEARFVPRPGFTREMAEQAVHNFVADCAGGVRRVLARGA